MNVSDLKSNNIIIQGLTSYLSGNLEVAKKQKEITALMLKANTCMVLSCASLDGFSIASAYVFIGLSVIPFAMITFLVLSSFVLISHSNI